MIERLEIQPDLRGMFGYNESLMQDKINELVDWANGIDKLFIPLDGGETGVSAEPTEKMYTLDEVAEMMMKVCDEPPCEICHREAENLPCFRTTEECWKHAIQSGWPKGE